MKVKIEGSLDLNQPFYVMFKVVKASGKVELSNIFCFDSILDAEEFVDKFFKVRSRVPMASYTLFGGGYPVQSLEWLACHSCYVKILDRLDDVVTYSTFICHPYLAKILKSVD